MGKKIKVCHLSTVHPAFDTRIFHKECKSLVQAGYDVTLIAQHEEDEEADGIQIIALPKPKNRIQRMFSLTFRALWFALKQKADIYHFHDSELLPIGILVKFLGKKVVYDVHESVQDIDTKTYLPPIIRSQAVKLVRILQKIAILCFDFIVVAGSDIAEEFDKRNNIVIIRNYPMLGWLDACKSFKSENLPENIIVYLGVISEDRCIREYVKAMEYVKSKSELWVIGPFDSPLLETEMEIKNNNKIKFLGRIPYTKVPEYLSKASIGLVCFYPLPNNIEAVAGRNNKVYEYMSAGLSIICSNIPGWKEVIEGNQVGITVNPKDPKEIGLAIDYLLENTDLRKKMKTNGLRLFREKFNWEAEIVKLLEIYSKILKI